MTVAEMVKVEGELAVHLEPYVGRWVAVIEHRVAYDADSLSELLERLSEEAQQTATVFQVPEDGGTACYF
ncbi:MAG: DUF5678 domain-containing protein [Solirubrobacteraceae bacterium]